MAKTKKPETEGIGIPFEEALERLEAIVRRLESEALTLDDSLELFQEGVGLSRYCQQKLAEAETKIDFLLCGKDGQLELTPASVGE